jgi:Holliday junction resolvase RusA-like endonuclease
VTVAFTVHGIPQPAGSKRAFQNRHTGRIVVTDDAKRSRPWKTDVTEAAAVAMLGAPLLDGPLLLELRFWMPRPKGHYGTGRNAGQVRASAPRFPAVKPDVLKLARAVEDALTGIVYRDDAQIVTETLEKAYTSAQARCEVRVVPIEQATQPKEAT